MSDQVAMWPPMLSTRERLTIRELGARLLRSGDDIEVVLATYVPITDRFWELTTYGKAAFELAIRSAGLAGATIILPAFISHDFVGVMQKHNITPVFIDVDLRSWQIDATRIDARVLDASESLVLLHAFGLPADGRSFRELCDRHDLVLIEDCARAFGAHNKDGLVGSHGDFAVYSLSKIAPVRRGGLLVSRTPIPGDLDRAQTGFASLANSALLLKMPGLNALEGPLYRLVRESSVYPGEAGLYDSPIVEHPERIVAIFLEAFLPSYSETLRRRREIGLEIRHRLEPFGFEFQDDSGDHIYTTIGAIVPDGVDRRALRAHLLSRGINSYTLWGDPLGVSPVAVNAWGTNPEAFPNTAVLASRLLHFPINRFMGSREVDRIVSACLNSTKEAAT